MTHRLYTNYAKNYCYRTLTVKVIVENVVTFFLGGGQYNMPLIPCSRVDWAWACNGNLSFLQASITADQTLG